MKVRAEKIVKRFGENTAVDGVSLEVDDGEFVVLVGPSGCGKTTTLRILAGLELQDSGDVYIGGERVNHLPPKDRDIAMVFQDYALYPHMNIFDNIAFPLRVTKTLSKAEIKARVTETARLLEIEDLLKRKPAETSGGEQQRIALARSIVRHPKAFFMDEPLSNLDAKLRVAMRTELQLLHRRLQVATVCVSHDQLDAMTLGTRIAVMDKGRILQSGPPRDVYSRPVNATVASFLGSPSMNMLPGAVEDGFIVLEAGSRVQVPHGGLGNAGRRVIVGIRAENLVLEANGASTGLKGDVYVSEQIGSDQYVHVRLTDGSAVVLRMPPDIPIAMNERVEVSWKGDDMLVFDEESGERVSPA
jgi:ABC-type sugar transport system ATPase subunit